MHFLQMLILLLNELLVRPLPSFLELLKLIKDLGLQKNLTLNLAPALDLFLCGDQTLYVPFARSSLLRSVDFQATIRNSIRLAIANIKITQRTSSTQQ